MALDLDLNLDLDLDGTDQVSSQSRATGCGSTQANIPSWFPDLSFSALPSAALGFLAPNHLNYMKTEHLIRSGD